MRISTRQIYTQGIEAFQQQQQKLARLQQQISTGIRLNKPSDDPAAASKVLELEQSLSLNLQFQSNINLAAERLQQQDTVLAAYDNLLIRVRELAVQGNNAPLDTTARAAIAAGRPKTRYAAGKMAKMLLRSRALLSDRMFDKAVTRELKKMQK